jgi:hypothetical protein
LDGLRLENAAFKVTLVKAFGAFPLNISKRTSEVEVVQNVFEGAKTQNFPELTSKYGRYVKSM